MRTTRHAAALVALLLGLVGAAGLAAPAAEAAPGRCQPGTGVTVVVDYGALGRSTGIGCDPGGGGDPASRVVPAAGFPLTYAAGQPFVCRVDGLPDASQEACQQTPPADAYWGLFWNDGKGGGWVYSSQGVAALRVPAGGSIGWRWQDGGDRDLPRESPNPPAPAPKPTKPPSNGGGGAGAHSATPTPTPSSTPSPSQSASQGAADKKKKPDEAKKKDAGDEGKKKKQKQERDEDDESASPSPSETESAESAEAGDEVALSPTSTTPADDGGDEWLLLAGAAAVVLLGGAAGILAWRRRT